jgi:GNAT superfamily N-acetyltransferase
MADMPTVDLGSTGAAASEADAGRSVTATAAGQIVFRHHPLPTDAQAIRELVGGTGFFYPPEVDVAVELVDERLAKGESSGYYFVFVESDGRIVGYTCYGPIACTVASYDLYWIAVDQRCQGRGLGRRLLQESEQLIAGQGGRRVYIETSSRQQYEPTREFYLRCGYEHEATLVDFYDTGDNKVIYVKRL